MTGFVPEPRLTSFGMSMPTLYVALRYVRRTGQSLRRKRRTSESYFSWVNSLVRVHRIRTVALRFDTFMVDLDIHEKPDRLIDIVISFENLRNQSRGGVFLRKLEVVVALLVVVVWRTGGAPCDEGGRMLHCTEVFTRGQTVRETLLTNDH
jgi:hypothetical protein